MNEADNFALVPKPPGALEKTQLGARYILTGMVADTLALANAPRALRVIILDDEEGPRECYKIILGDYSRNLVVQEFTNGNEAWTELTRTHPELFITDLRHPGLECYEMLRRLAESRASFPVFVITAYETPDSLRRLREFENAGLNLTYMHKPITVQQFRAELLKHFGRDLWHASNENASPSTKKSPLRIVLVNVEEGPLHSMRVVLRDFKGVTLLFFEKAHEAWQELLQADPDLLITAARMPGMSGVEIAHRLLDRQATFPIIVTTTYEPDELLVRELASREANVSCLTLPFDIDDFRTRIEMALKIRCDKGEHSESAKGKP